MANSKVVKEKEVLEENNANEASEVTVVTGKEKAIAIWNKVKKPLAVVGLFIAGAIVGGAIANHANNSEGIDNSIDDDYIEIDDSNVTEE